MVAVSLEELGAALDDGAKSKALFEQGDLSQVLTLLSAGLHDGDFVSKRSSALAAGLQLLLARPALAESLRTTLLPKSDEDEAKSASSLSALLADAGSLVDLAAKGLVGEQLPKGPLLDHLLRLSDTIVEAAVENMNKLAGEGSAYLEVVRNHRNTRVHEVQPGGLDAFIDNFGGAFNKFTMGHPEEIENYARECVQKLCLACPLLNEDPGSVELVGMVAVKLPKASSLLVERMVEILAEDGKKVRVGSMVVRRSVPVLYQGQDQACKRFALATQMGVEYEDSLAKGSRERRHAVFVDDAIISGTSYAKLLVDMLARGLPASGVSAISVVTLFGINLSTEASLNTVYFNPEAPAEVLASRALDVLEAQRRARRACTVRSVRLVLRMPEPAFKFLLEGTTPEFREWFRHMIELSDSKEAAPSPSVVAAFGLTPKSS